MASQIVLVQFPLQFICLVHFSHPQLGDTTGYQYTRESNPTRDRLEQLIAGLEEGTDALAFSSGMAAVDAVFHLFSPGDHIILGDDLYGGSIRMFTNIYEQKWHRVYLCRYI